ncbi:MAG: response regulator [Planctomycetes bacterium]|nr:response regulator [Planctomycetota bacterium]
MANTSDLADMFAAVVQALVETTGFSRASALTFDAGGVMRFRASQGLSDEYRCAVDGHSPWRPDSKDVAPIFVDDVETAGDLRELLPVFRREGIGALAFLPLAGGGRLLGKFMLYSGQPVRWRDRDLGFASAAADLLASFLLREEVNEKLLHARRMQSLGLLAGGIAHDFNNLLTTILGYVDLLRGETVRGTPARDYVEQLLQASQHAAELTRQLLGFARPDGRAHEVVDLREFVAEVRPSFERLCGAERALSVQLPDAPVAVVGSRSQLHQLLLNLVTNACNAMPEGGALSIVLAPVAGSDSVELVVTDTGVGMDEATRVRVFEPMFTTRPDGQGTGLGLATCYAITAAMGGDIAVRSELGRGTSFVVRLPRARAAIEAAVPAPMPLGRVLLVEDQENVRAMLVRALRAMGYDVATAVNGRDAMAQLGLHAADIVVTDVVMPELGGIELARLVRARWPATQVLLVTGYVDAPDGVPDGVPVLHKPFLPRELGHQLRRLLGR